MSCIITRKSRASIRGKLHHCQTYMRYFSHRRKYTACSSQDSLAYIESRHDTFPQFSRSSLGTRGLQTRSHRRKKKKRLHFQSLALLKQARLISQSRQNERDSKCIKSPSGGLDTRQINYLEWNTATLKTVKEYCKTIANRYGNQITWVFSINFKVDFSCL